MGCLRLVIALLALKASSVYASGSDCAHRPTSIKTTCDSTTVGQLIPDPDRGVTRRCMSDGSTKFEGCIVHGSEDLVTVIGTEFDDGLGMWRQCKALAAIAKMCLAYDKNGEKEKVDLFESRVFPDKITRKCTPGGWMDQMFGKFCAAYIPVAPQKSAQTSDKSHGFSPDSFRSTAQSTVPKSSTVEGLNITRSEKVSHDATIKSESNVSDKKKDSLASAPKPDAPTISASSKPPLRSKSVKPQGSVRYRFGGLETEAKQSQKSQGSSKSVSESKTAPAKQEPKKDEKRLGTVRASTTGSQRTIILINIPDSDKDTPVFIRGGVTGMNDGVAFLRGGAKLCQGSRSIDGRCPISIIHAVQNSTSKAFQIWLQGDKYLDWTGFPGEKDQGKYEGKPAHGTPLAWSTNDPSANDSYPLNTFGPNYWVFDAKMACGETRKGYFEFQTYVNDKWEKDIHQTQRCGGADVIMHSFESIYHVGMCGFVNVFNHNDGRNCTIRRIPTVTAAELTQGRTQLRRTSAKLGDNERLSALKPK